MQWEYSAPVLAPGCTDEEKVRIAKARDGKFRADGSFVSQKVSQHDSPDLSGHPVGEDPVQPVFGTRAARLELGHRRHLEKPD